MEFDSLRNPAARYRSAPFWSWNDKLDRVELLRQIDEMHKKGWGGFFMHSRVGLVTGYLSDEWMELISMCASEAGERGMDAWIYDEDKWPSGYAGGEIARNPSLRGKALVMLPADSPGDNDFPLGSCTHGGSDWVFAVRTMPLGDPWFNGFSYVDLMNPATMDAFLASTHEKYKEKVGMHFGKGIPGVFTDEPCYCMANKFEGTPALPWSDSLPAWFFGRKGYSLQDVLPSLFFDMPDSRKVRYDFFESATLLFCESFSKPYRKWCHDNGLLFTGHYMAEETFESQIRWIGAAMPHYRYQDWPGIDKLGRHLEQVVTVKQVTSAVDQFGKERAFCEVFGCIGQNASFFTRKWISDWQAVLGISFVNSHLSLYSMRGERKRDYPANLFFQQPWWEQERGFADYTARLCAVAGYGKRSVDVLVIHPIGSAWCDFSAYPARPVWDSEVDVWYRPFEMLSRKLLERKVDFHYGDELLLEESGSIEEGSSGSRIRLGLCSYDTVIVPPGCSLRPSTRQILEVFARKNPDRILLVEPVPELSGGEPAAGVLPGRRFPTVEAAADAALECAGNRISVIDLGAGKEAETIWVTRRTGDEGEVLLFVSTEEKRPVDSLIKLVRSEPPLVMDLADGALYDSASAFDPAERSLRMKYSPAGSLVLVYPSGQSVSLSKELPPVLGSGVVPGRRTGQKDEIGTMSGVPVEWTVEVDGPNILVLDRVTLDLDGKRVLTDEPVCKAWHPVFYAAPEGCSFRAEYSFLILGLPAETPEFLIESAENLDAIHLNGNLLKPARPAGAPVRQEDGAGIIDPSFTRVDTAGHLVTGRNLLVLEGRKSNNITGPCCHVAVPDWNNHQPTEVETAMLYGHFAVGSDDDCRFFVSGDSRKKPDGRNLADSGFPFYAGTATYRTEYFWEPGRPAILRLRSVSAVCASVRVQGNPVRVLYWDPWIVDLSGVLVTGNNSIEVVLYNHLYNLTGPSRHVAGPSLQFTGPETFVDHARMGEKVNLVPFGMGSAMME